MNKYTLGDYAGASVLFEKAAGAAATKPLAKVDTTALYNSGFTAWMVKDYPRAKDLFEKCLAVEYYYEGGEVFAKLADIYTNLGEKEAIASLALVNQLRHLGVSAELYPDSAKMKKQMEYANRRQIPFVVIIGSNELEQGVATLKNMATGEQQTLPIATFADAVKEVL
jgi:tetratricopeptide (TPR) repeat protein